jgi:hypothetical protein
MTELFLDTETGPSTRPDVLAHIARVWGLICAGHLDRVAAYCADDVRRVRAIYRAITAVR